MGHHLLWNPDAYEDKGQRDEQKRYRKQRMEGPYEGLLRQQPMQLARSYQTAHQRYHTHGDSQQSGDVDERPVATRGDGFYLSLRETDATGREHTHQSGCTATESVEEGYGLRHLYHLHLAGHHRTYQGTDNQGGPDGPCRHHTGKAERSHHTCQHGQGREQIATHGRLHPTHHRYARHHHEGEHATDYNLQG